MSEVVVGFTTDVTAGLKVNRFGFSKHEDAWRGRERIGWSGSSTWA
jgi:hypothetical protein